MDPRLRALYLLLIAVGVFFLPDLWMVGAVGGLQVVLYLGLGLGVRPLLRQLRKLTLFLSVIFIAYALVGTGGKGQDWRPLVWGLEWSVEGTLVGLTMVLRIVAVVLASQVCRAGDPRALASGLGKLGMPRMAALAIDAVLALFGSEGKQRDAAGGGGGGGGRGRGGGGKGTGRGGGGGSGGGKGKSAKGFFGGLKRLARGNVRIIADRLNEHVDRAASYIMEKTGEEDRALARDVAVIAGIALTMLSVKVLKLLPGLPFAPGHKGVILIPLYFVAAKMTRSKLGATWTGLTMGAVAFLMGDGRWGIFEVLKHMAPGLLADLLVPLLGSSHGRLGWGIIGWITAMGRFATVTAIALAVQPPAVVYAVLVPGLLFHSVFGALSGVVTAPLIRAIEERAPPNRDE